MRKLFFVFIVLLVLSIAGCATLDRAYVEADIKTYNVVAPDLMLTYQQIEDPFVRWIKLKTIITWTDRIIEALRDPDLAELKIYFKPVEIKADPFKKKAKNERN